MRTVKISSKKADFISDSYQRPIQWVLSVPDLVRQGNTVSPNLRSSFSLPAESQDSQNACHGLDKEAQAEKVVKALESVRTRRRRAEKRNLLLYPFGLRSARTGSRRANKKREQLLKLKG